MVRKIKQRIFLNVAAWTMIGTLAFAGAQDQKECEAILGAPGQLIPLANLETKHLVCIVKRRLGTDPPPPITRIKQHLIVDAESGLKFAAGKLTWTLVMVDCQDLAPDVEMKVKEDLKFLLGDALQQADKLSSDDHKAIYESATFVIQKDAKCQKTTPPRITPVPCDPAPAASSTSSLPVCAPMACEPCRPCVESPPCCFYVMRKSRRCWEICYLPCAPVCSVAESPRQSPPVPTPALTKVVGGSTQSGAVQLPESSQIPALTVATSHLASAPMPVRETKPTTLEPSVLTVEPVVESPPQYLLSSIEFAEFAAKVASSEDCRLARLIAIKGCDQFHRRNYHEAIAKFDEAIRRDPKSTLAWSYRTLAILALSQDRAAEQSAEQVRHLLANDSARRVTLYRDLERAQGSARRRFELLLQAHDESEVAPNIASSR